MRKKEIARLDDLTTGYCSSCEETRSGKVSSSAQHVFCEGKEVARDGDEVTATCGHKGTIVASTKTVAAEKTLIARKTDSFTGTYSGTIIQGALNSFTGD
jgi:uncharacterized Zn-binding protein involved in type VI secretion